MKIPMKLVYQYMVIFINFSPTSSYFHPLQVVNCDSNSRLVVDEDDNGKFRLERAYPCAAVNRLVYINTYRFNINITYICDGRDYLWFAKVLKDIFKNL